MNNKRSCNLLLHGGARHNDRRECYWYLEARAIDRRQQGGAFCLSTRKKKEMKILLLSYRLLAFLLSYA